MTDLIDWMESMITLHFTFEFLYVVDGYQVEYLQDATDVIARSYGATLREALEKMRGQLE